MTTAGDFLDLNAQQRLVRTHPNVHKLRPGVVRRNRPEPEPDREFVDTSGQTMSAPEPPKEEAPPVAAKKKRAKVDADTRAVAVARVDKLINAGNRAAKAVASVAKELGVSDSAVVNWRTAARKAAAAKPANGKRASKRAAPSNGHAEPPAPLGALAQDALAAVVTWLDPIVREIVSEEIRRRLS